jgi:hypothetical protein
MAQVSQQPATSPRNRTHITGRARSRMTCGRIFMGVLTGCQACSSWGWRFRLPPAGPRVIRSCSRSTAALRASSLCSPSGRAAKPAMRDSSYTIRPIAAVTVAVV